MDFSFVLEADIDMEKSSPDSGRRVIRGYGSTPHEDRQSETLLQKGLDISDFVKHGYFNYDHDNSIILGYPYPTCKIDDNGFWIEGELLKGVPKSDDLWTLALALKKSDAPRKLGFSVEGKILERQGTKILKAKVYNVAVTPNPVNTNCTWEAMVKSFRGLGDSDLIKTLEAGYEVDPTKLEGGGVFRKESLEESLHNLSYVLGDEDKKKILKDTIKVKKSLSNRELILYLQLIKGWSYSESLQYLQNL